MEKKYRTEKHPETGLLRIIALKDFSDVKKGDRGGLISDECNLSQKGNCWVYDNAEVHGEAKVFGNAKVYGHAFVCVNARIYEDAKIYGDAMIGGNAKVSGSAKICGDAWIYGNAVISGNVKLWSTYSNYNNGNSNVTAALVKNSKDFIILEYNRKEFLLIFLSNINTKNITFTTIEVDYIKNIQTIRQLYGEEV